MTTLKEELKSIQSQLRRLEQRQMELYKASMAAPENEKICPDDVADMMAEPMNTLQFPIEVQGIAFSEDAVLGPLRTGRRKHGSWVRIRPCLPECKNNTYLGLYVGDIALASSVTFNRSTGVLGVRPGMHNPAIFVFALNRIVFGCESWWGVVTSPEDLREISTEDINSVWYMRALKEISGSDSSYSDASGDAKREPSDDRPSGSPPHPGSAGS